MLKDKLKESISGLLMPIHDDLVNMLCSFYEPAFVAIDKYGYSEEEVMAQLKPLIDSNVQVISESIKAIKADAIAKDFNKALKEKEHAR